MGFNKRGENLQRITIHLILIAIIFLIFLMANFARFSNRGVKQEVLEKQIALMIDSAVPGMTFEIDKVHKNGEIDNVILERGRVFVNIEGLKSMKGYPYFSRYDVDIDSGGGKFKITIS